MFWGFWLFEDIFLLLLLSLLLLLLAKKKGRNPNWLCLSVCISFLWHSGWTIRPQIETFLQLLWSERFCDSWRLFINLCRAVWQLLEAQPKRQAVTNRPQTTDFCVQFLAIVTGSSQGGSTIHKMKESERGGTREALVFDLSSEGRKKVKHEPLKYRPRRRHLLIGQLGATGAEQVECETRKEAAKWSENGQSFQWFWGEGLCGKGNRELEEVTGEESGESETWEIEVWHD